MHRTAATIASEPLPLQGAGAQRPTRFRWIICALLVFATTINYMDRQIIGVLKPTMQKELGWSEIDYSNIVFAFQIAYAGGQLIAGRMMDLFGVRLGYAVAASRGMATAKIVGYVLEFTGSYYTLFAAASSMYLIGLSIIQVLVPKIETGTAGSDGASSL